MGMIVYEDLNFLKNPNVDMSKLRLVLHGCSIRSRRILMFLKDAGIQPFAYYDRNRHLHGGRVDGLSVISRDCVLKLEGEIWIVACINRPKEAWEEWTSAADNFNGVVIHFLSAWAVEFSLCLHCQELYKRTSESWKVFERDQDLRKIWLTRLGIRYLEELAGASKDTICVAQAGKVGSVSLMNMLNESGINSIQMHRTNYPAYLLGEKWRKIWEAARSRYFENEIRIVTMIREPVARDYSAFWQPFSEKNERVLLMDFITGDLQKSYEQYLTMIMGDLKKLEENLKETTPWVWRDEFRWYDEELKRATGVDIYEYPFDIEKGYEIIEKDNVKIFLYKLENFEDVVGELGNFVGRSLVYEKRHSSEDKWFSMAYEEFKKKVKIPREYLEYYYLGNEKVNHFYSENERIEVVNRWENQVI